MPAKKTAAPTATRDAEKTRTRILDAARTLFSKLGVDGANVEAIARAAHVNKRMIYYYFGSKADLYLTVLEETYANRRLHDSVLDMNVGDPEQCIRRLVRASFRYCRDNPDYIKLLLAENLGGAKHLQRSQKIKHLQSPLLENLGALIRRGQEDGVFRAHVDPLQVYLTIASLCFFYHSNTATLTTIFDRNFSSDERSIEREAHIEDVVLSYLRPRTTVSVDASTEETTGH